MHSVKRTVIAGCLIAAAPSVVHATSHTVLTVGGVSLPGIVDGSLDGVGDSSYISNYGVPMRCDGKPVNLEIYRGEGLWATDLVAEMTELPHANCNVTHFDIPVSIGASSVQVQVVAAPAAAGDPVDVQLLVDVTVTSISPSIPCDFGLEGTVRATLTPGTNGISPADGTLEFVPVAFTGATPIGGFDLEAIVGGAGATCAGEVVDGDQFGAWWVDSLSTQRPTYEITTDGLGDVSHS